jgi:hypothetical protein
MIDQDRRLMRYPIPLFTIVLSLAASALFAQSTGPYATTFSANLDVAYHENLDFDSHGFDVDSHVGAHFDIAATVKRDVPLLAVVGEAGVNRFSDATIATVMAGVRVRIPIQDDRFLPFAEVLGGLYHCSACDENDFAIEAGGGVDFRLPRIRSFRLRAQADFRHVAAERRGFDAVRLSGGIVLPWSGR